MVANRKGVAWIAIFFLIAIIVVITGWLFFAFFKVHITSILVDVDSINRYQEIPTTLLGISTFVEDEEKQKSFDENNPDKRDKTKINCFNGDGPAGAHPPNIDMCRKHLTFYLAKTANSVGKPVLSSPTGRDAGPVLPGVLDLVIWLGKVTSPPPNFPTLSLIKNNVRASLPESCYKISIENAGKEIDKLDPYSDLPDDLGSGKNQLIETKFAKDCGLDSPKINEPYPLPILFNGDPTLAVQRLLIYSSVTSSERVLVTWPRYSTNFVFGGGSSSP